MFAITKKSINVFSLTINIVQKLILERVNYIYTFLIVFQIRF